MSVNRVRVAKDKAELVQSLVHTHDNRGPFQTYADVLAFAAAFGAKSHKRVPLGAISAKEPAPISLEVFVSRGYDTLIKLLAIAEYKDTTILSHYDPSAEGERLQIFEEYANGGLEKLRDELRGAVDYTERLLLILCAARFPEQASTEEFNLSKFL